MSFSWLPSARSFDIILGVNHLRRSTMPETCIYKLDYQYHSSSSLAWDEMHATEIVEAPKNIGFRELETLCRQKIPGFWSLNNFKEVNVWKLV